MITDAKRKERKRYEEMKMPYEKLKFLPEASFTFEQLDAHAAKMSNNDAAVALTNARKKLFQAISTTIKKQA